jgi:hypothetical protein
MILIVAYFNSVAQAKFETICFYEGLTCGPETSKVADFSEDYRAHDLFFNTLPPFLISFHAFAGRLKQITTVLKILLRFLFSPL